MQHHLNHKKIKEFRDRSFRIEIFFDKLFSLFNKITSRLLISILLTC